MTDNRKKTVLEENKRFSESLLWTLQKNAYEAFGPQAWVDQGVPSYLTSNPWTARKYAGVTLGYIRDCLSKGLIDSAEPLYIFDLGAGSGRFGYIYLKYLLDAVQKLFKGRITLKYVMTDIVKSNIDFIMTHPYLKPYVEQGILDCAFFRHDQSETLHLIHGKSELGSTKNPAVIIGNYFFDTIPQDYFLVRDGKLEEGRISLYVEGPVSDKTDPALIQRLERKFTYTKLDELPSYYEQDPELNTVLKEYVEKQDNIPLLFPIGAFQVIKYFQKLTQNRLLVIAGDQGVSTIEQMRKLGEPRIDKHGTFSIPVCYHALKTYFDVHNGVGLLTDFSNPLFTVMSGVFSGAGDSWPETVFAFGENIDFFEPKDYWNLVEFTEKATQNMTLDHLILLLKLGYWDPINFYAFFQSIRERLAVASDEQKRDLSVIVDKLFEQFYPVSKEEGGFIINLGVVCFEIGRYRKAIEYFEKAIEWSGASASVYRNIAACYAKQSLGLKALEYIDKAEKLQ